MSTLSARVRSAIRLAPAALAAAAALAGCAPVGPAGFPPGMVASDGAPDGYGVLLSAVQAGLPGFSFRGGAAGGAYGGPSARPDASRDRTPPASGFARPGSGTPMRSADARTVAPAGAHAAAAPAKAGARPASPAREK